MATIPKPKLLNLHINSNEVKKIMTYMGVAEQKAAAQEFINQIENLYHDAEGNKFVWKVATYYTNRKDRSYAVAVCQNPEIRFQEARHGRIRAKLRELSTNKKIRVTLQANGSFKIEA